MFSILINSLKKGLLTQPIALPAVKLQGLDPVGEELRRIIYSHYGRSLHIREVDTGSCGACESEIAALNNPIYDIQRFGIDFVASPRHADALLITGAMSRNMVLALKKTYDAMPSPKFVITVGQCASESSIFSASYYTSQEKIREITGAQVLHIPGCPPDPKAMLIAILSFLKDQHSRR